jgi:hypothetical protein
VPQFDLPFRVEAGAVVEADQDSIEDIDNCVEVIVRTPVGSHLDDLDLGVPDETFRLLGPNPSAKEFLSVIEEQEPRAHLLGEARLEELRILHISIRSAP